jgi:hypothetical protein
VPLPAVEVAVSHGLPTRGSRTSQMKVLQATNEAHSLRLELEGVGGSESVLRVRRNDAKVQVRAEGGVLEGDSMRVRFPAGVGYVTQVVTLRW